MTNSEALLLSETLKHSFEVVEYRVNMLGEERTSYYKLTKKKLMKYVEENGLKVRRINEYPNEIESNTCYISSTGKLVWMKVKVE